MKSLVSVLAPFIIFFIIISIPLLSYLIFNSIEITVWTSFIWGIILVGLCSE